MEAAQRSEQDLRDAGDRLEQPESEGGALDHPNILAGDDASEPQGQGAPTATQLVGAEHLDEHLARVGKLPALQALALLAQLLSALEHAHAHGVVHGRLGPEHILITRTGRLKLAGLGQSQPGGSTDRRADVDAAAVIAYQLLTGTPPAARGAALIPPHSLRADLPPALDGVFQRALSQDAAARYPTAGRLSAALRTAFDPPLWDRTAKPAVRATEGVPAVREPVEQPARAVVVPRPAAVAPVRRSRKSRPLAVAAGCAVALLLAIGWMAGQLFPREAPPVVTAPTPGAAAPMSVPVAEVAPPAAAAPVAPAAPAPGATAQVEGLDEGEAVVAPGPVDTGPRPVARAIDDTDRIEREPRQARIERDSAERAERPARRHASARATALAQRQSSGSGPDFACRSQQLAITHEICRVAMCATDAFRGHPTCVRMHAEQRVRDRLADQAMRTR